MTTALLLPIVVPIDTATRLAATRREQRLTHRPRRRRFVGSLPILTGTKGGGALCILAAVTAMLTAGIVIIGPWLTTRVGKVLIWASCQSATMLAGYPA